MIIYWLFNLDSNNRQQSFCVKIDSEFFQFMFSMLYIHVLHYIVVLAYQIVPIVNVHIIVELFMLYVLADVRYRNLIELLFVKREAFYFI